MQLLSIKIPVEFTSNDDYINLEFYGNLSILENSMDNGRFDLLEKVVEYLKGTICEDADNCVYCKQTKLMIAGLRTRDSNCFITNISVVRKVVFNSVFSQICREINK